MRAPWREHGDFLLAGLACLGGGCVAAYRGEWLSAWWLWAIGSGLLAWSRLLWEE